MLFGEKNSDFSILSNERILHSQSFSGRTDTHPQKHRYTERERNQMHTYKNVPLVAKFRLLRATTAYRGGGLEGNARTKARTVFTPTAIECKKKSGFASEILNRTREKVQNTVNGREENGFQNRKALRPGALTTMRKVYEDTLKPHYADSGVLPPYNDSKYQFARTPDEIEGMRKAGLLAAEVLDYAESLCQPGVTTEEIDEKVHLMIIDAGAYPSPLNYGEFPKSVCTSLNECICHGIPTPDETLLDGDIINVDVTVYLNGYHGDTSRTIRVGKVSEQVETLCRVTEDALEAAIKIVKPGVPLRRIGATIHDVADKHKFGVVDKFVGHGVGKEFHSGPTIRHHRNNDPGTIEAGMTFTIEPMLTIGGTRDIMWKDGWTSVTADGKWTAQCEHTLLVTVTGCEIMTLSPAKKALGDHLIRGAR